MADGNITVTVNARADEVAALIAEVERLRAALILSVQAMRAPLDDWKGEVERMALDAAALALGPNVGINRHCPVRSNDDN